MGSRDHYLLLNCDGGERSINEALIDHVEIEVSGRGWLYGALVGALVDVTIVTIGVMRYENRPNP